MKSTFQLSCLKKAGKWQITTDSGATQGFVTMLEERDLPRGVASMIEQGIRHFDQPATGPAFQSDNGHSFKLTLVLGETQKDTLVLSDLKRQKRAVFTPDAECSVDNSIAGCARWAAGMIIKAIS